MKRILVFNTGSTTLKYKLFELEDNQLTITKQGSVDSIGQEIGPKNHKIALSILFQGFGIGRPSLAKIENLVAIGHRVVHGGNEFTKPTIVTREVIKKLEKYNLMAPLHNPHILEVMQDILDHSGRKGHREIPNYAVFDSSYFKDLPPITKIYPLPYEFYLDYGIQRFGFDGISHKYVVDEVLKRYPQAKKIISLHLGSGCSITAIKDGKPIDTSMGFTTLEGLMMTTRSGDIDAGIIHYLIEHKFIHHPDVDIILNYKSGLYGISGGEADMRELLYISGYKVEDPEYRSHTHLTYLTEEKKERTRLAVEMFIYRIKKYIGAYNAILGSIDVLVFTGGIGVGSSVIREMILEGLDSILQNAKIEVIKADEEAEIAKEILRVI